MSDYEQQARKYRKKAVLDVEAASFEKVAYGPSDIETLIPHRPPFRLVDSITGIDLAQEGIVGARTIDPADPVFQGHFPTYPILPGVLQIEMIGQLAICFYDFHKRRSIELPKESTELGVRALKIFHTLFQHEVLPGDTVTILAKLLEKDDYTFKGIGQVMNGSKVCTIAIAEFYIV